MNIQLAVFCFKPGQSSHDPVKVPFALAPEAQTEGQFAFNIQDITVPQKLKGTLTYMVQVKYFLSRLRNYKTLYLLYCMFSSKDNAYIVKIA